MGTTPNGHEQSEPADAARRPRAPTITVHTVDDLDPSPVALPRLSLDEQHAPFRTLDHGLSRSRRGSQSTRGLSTSGHKFLDIRPQDDGESSRTSNHHDGSSTTTMTHLFSLQRSSSASSTGTLPKPQELGHTIAPELHTMDSPFAFSPTALGEAIKSKSIAELEALGGLHGLADGLQTDVDAGLQMDGLTQSSHQGSDDDDGLTQARKDTYGANRIPKKKTKGILELMLLAFSDKVLILLSIVAAISLMLGIYQAFGRPHAPDQPRVEWVDGVTIMTAVIIVVVTCAVNDYQMERQFASLIKKRDNRLVKVIRSGRLAEISVFDVLVGDVVRLDPGDLVPADGVLISGHSIMCDESSITGESDQIEKVSGTEALSRLAMGAATDTLDPYIVSGSKVSTGIGTFLVTGVGENSVAGQLQMSMSEPSEPTPLQKKLGHIADKIAIAGVAVAVVLFVVLSIKFMFRLAGTERYLFEVIQAFLQIFMVSIAIVVIAVPEGLPLAVTLALAIAVTRMLKDNNLVRMLAACETMGNATTVCCDKTGTLTTNNMSVVCGALGANGQFSDLHHECAETGALQNVEAENTQDSNGQMGNASSQSPAESTWKFCSSLDPSVRDIMIKSIAVNSTAFEGEQDGVPAFIGSQTEAGLLKFAKTRLGMRPLQEERSNADIVEVRPFDSSKKYMATVTKLPNGTHRIYVKGAPEILIKKCSAAIHSASLPLGYNIDLLQEHRKALREVVDGYASRSLRTMGFAYKDVPAWSSADASDNNEAIDDILVDLTLVGVLGLRDPLRPEVADAVEKCLRAGVVVRMVTGDSRHTAEAVARECGILTGSGVVMEGSKFRKLSDEEKDKILPNLRVLARSSPQDKKTLVKRLKHLGETVAVTGDGTNDGPALKAADVGFSMGISGTDIAKEASCIVLMDDNFASIVKAVEWGRSINDAIKKFLHFQLTVNITAVTVTFVSAITSDKEESILTPVQLLWVNLIMDTFAALALATDRPNPAVLLRNPESKSQSLISPAGWKMILGQAIYQLAVVLVLNFKATKILEHMQAGSSNHVETFIFNTFVWMQFFNLYNNRRLDNRKNIFEGLHQNPFFIVISVIIITGQVLIVNFGGDALSATPLSAKEWILSLTLGAMCMPVAMLTRSVPDVVITSAMRLGQYVRRPDSAVLQDVQDNVTLPQVSEDCAEEHLASNPSSSSLFQRLRGEVSRLVTTATRKDDIASGGIDERTPLISN